MSEETLDETYASLDRWVRWIKRPQMTDKMLIETYVKLIVERQVKQAYLSGDRTSEWGSEDHITDLESRCADAAYWRDKYPKGSERRGHYRNVYNTLKRELQSAKKKNQLNEKQKND